MSSFKQKFISGAAWNGSARIYSQAISFISTILLARILEPKDFGTLAMVTAITGFLGYFSDPGVVTNIVRKETVDAQELNTAHWMSIIFILMITGIIFLAAPLLGYFYENDTVVALARVMAIIFVMTACTMVPIGLCVKNLDYKTISIIRIIAATVSMVVAVKIAYSGGGVWALVFQQVTLNLLLMLGIMIFVQWHAQLTFSLEKMKEQLAFGKHIMGNNLLKFSGENVDQIIVGRMLGANELGLYSMALRLSRYPITILGRVAGNVFLSAIAHLQNQPDKLKSNVTAGSLVISIIAAPALVFLFLNGESLAVFALGEKWASAGSLIQIFIPLICLQLFGFMDTSCAIVLNLISKANKLLLIFLLLFITLAVPSAYYIGITGVAISYIIAFGLYQVTLKYSINKGLGIDTIRQLIEGLPIWLYYLAVISIHFLSTYILRTSSYFSPDPKIAIAVSALCASLIFIPLVYRYRHLLNRIRR